MGDEDGSFLSVIGGAPGSIISEAIDAVPIIDSVRALSNPEHFDEFMPTMGEWVGVTREISSVNNAFEFYYALALGKYISQRGTVMDDDITMGEALVSGLTGAHPERVTKAFLEIDTLKTFRDVKQDMLSNAREAFRKADLTDDPAERASFVRRANVYLDMAGTYGLTQNQRRRFMQQVLRESYGQSLVESVSEQLERTRDQIEINTIGGN